MKAILEIYVEDLPPSEFPQLLKQMEEKMKAALKARRLSYSNVSADMTVRRLIIQIEGLPTRQPDETVERKGPPQNIAFKDGKPTKALEGFLKKFRASESDVQIKDGYVYIKQRIEGMPTKDVLKNLFKDFILSLEFKKPMKWADGKYQFVRPVHGILALLDNELIDFEVFDVKTSRKTLSHRLENKTIEINSTYEYFEKLKENFVIASVSEREAFVKKQLDESPYQTDMDEELIREVTYLSEYPKAVMGKFDEKYLSLPEEIIITTVKHHERIFATFENEKTLPFFIAFQDGPQDSEEIKKGFERVINARLEDARYYFQKDLQSSFDEWNEQLKGIVFQQKLGSLYDKVERVVKLSEILGSEIGYKETEKLIKAARICKADIASKVVYEFPELQGTMGRIYATIWGEDQGVAKAIEDHYQDLPQTILGAVIGFADKLDTIVGNFLIGNVPSGSKDPYGLRTKVDSLFAIIEKYEWKINLSNFIAQAKELIGIEGNLDVLHSFMISRFRVFLEGLGMEWDVARAVQHLWQEPLRGILSAKALNEIVASEELAALRVGFERVHNMTAKHDSKEYDGALLKEEAEIALMNEFFKVKDEVLKALENYDYKSAYNALTALKPHIDRYFDEVFVMVGREDLRRSRLGFLKNLDELFMMVADLTQISKERVIQNMES